MKQNLAALISNNEITHYDLADSISEKAYKIYTLAVIAATNDFSDYDKKFIQNYFCVIEELSNDIVRMSKALT